MSPESQEPIQNVSDTALWVAYCRAQEGKRANPLFHDPLAERLAGERGRQIAERMPSFAMMTWMMAIRTVAIDRLVHSAIREGCRTVLNLGTGLDTRPYRMDLPADLRWVEVDFPQIIELKNEVLAAEKPRCHLERIAADLSDRATARAIYDRIDAESEKVLVITEGVIIYLTNEQVAALAEDLRAHPRFIYWIQDFYSGPVASRMRKMWTKRMKHSPFRFIGDDWFAFFGAQGWRPRETIYTADESARTNRWLLTRLPWMLLLWMKGSKTRERYRRATGYVMMERS